ncbi:ATP-binding protein [Streptomyces cellulosae]|uniref:ATP-binding protein n=1 Tax=Streptomyces cellulosae TaxID=1968 RepID=UPI000AF21B2A
MATLGDVIQKSAASEASPDQHIRSFSVQLSPTSRGARLARLLATEQLHSWGLALDPARQIVAELAANAATHSRVPGRDFRLTLYVVADTLRIEMTDTCGERIPRIQSPASDAESGRGLVLVEALADRWGVAQGPRPRKVVWAELNLSPEHGNAQTCDGCDRAFRAPRPGRCRDCRNPRPERPRS